MQEAVELGRVSVTLNWTHLYAHSQAKSICFFDKNLSGSAAFPPAQTANTRGQENASRSRVFDKTKSGKARFVDINSEVRKILLELCKGKRPDDYVWVNPVTGGPYTKISKAFTRACADAKIEGLVWHDLRATYGTRLGEAGFNAYDVAKLMGHANISTSQRYVRNLPAGAVKRCY